MSNLLLPSTTERRTFAGYEFRSAMTGIAAVFTAILVDQVQEQSTRKFAEVAKEVAEMLSTNSRNGSAVVTLERVKAPEDQAFELSSVTVIPVKGHPGVTVDFTHDTIGDVWVVEVVDYSQSILGGEHSRKLTVSIDLVDDKYNIEREPATIPLQV